MEKKYKLLMLLFIIITMVSLAGFIKSYFSFSQISLNSKSSFTSIFWPLPVGLRY